MQINETAQETYATAVEKGWYEAGDIPPLVRHMLIVTEVAEATEAVRKGEPPVHVENGKPEGEAVELADCVIRVMDYFAHQGWDLEAVMRLKIDYNKTRSYRHGGKTL